MSHRRLAAARAAVALFVCGAAAAAAFLVAPAHTDGTLWPASSTTSVAAGADAAWSH